MRPAVFAFVFLLLIGANLPLPAQLRLEPVGERPGEVSLRLLLRKLGSVGTFMQTTAHPDDEDNALLAMMSHGEGMRSVLVSATRGDGGQNEIGPEIFQALGVLRTEELLAVHRFDGAEQYFTRAIDFGFSFSLDESVQKWGRDEIVGDYVRHIRATRPEVIAGFLCGGEGGGQHHQASTRLTAEAFRAAADAARYPEQIRDGHRPWQASRLFCTEGFAAPGHPGAAASRALLRVADSRFDPLLGRTYAEVGLEARSMHKCQGTSQLLLLPGQSPSRTYRLMDSAVGPPDAAPAHMFDGIDTTLAGLGAHAGSSPPAALITGLQAVGASVESATAAVAAKGSAAAAAPLARGLAAVRDLRARLPTLGLSDAARYEIDFRLAQKEEQFQAALLTSHGIRVEALADDGTVVAGQSVKVAVVAGNHGPADVFMKYVSIGEGSGSVCVPVVPRILAGGSVSCDMTLVVGDVPLSTPYWRPRADAARYDFEPDVPFGVPFRPTPFLATFTFSIGGADVTVTRAIEYRYSDLFAGEKRMELQVVPALAVRMTPAIAVIPAGVLTSAPDAAGASPGATKRPDVGHEGGPAAPKRREMAREGGQTRTIQVIVTSNQKAPVTATASLRLPAGWRTTPASAPVQFAREDEEVAVTFAVTMDAGVRPGEYAAESTVSAPGGMTSTSGYEVVDYPHIHRRHVVQPARTRVKVIDVRIAPGLRVGYIMGVGDEMPAAIEQLGATVDAIEPGELGAGDLSKYHVIVTGVRAYERRPDLRANNHRLLSYVENGGTVLVNYNKQEFNQAQYGPYPVRVGTDRVTDENAPVEVLAHGHPVFTTPNRIGPETWAGWVQERGTYFLGERDPRYVDLIRTTDPFPLNAAPKTGALVEARYGKGRWIYVGLGLWRQLPAGTDGAYRLLANLLSLGHR
jgi:LmbE family N-acetylglucosaminyl deacetylase